VRDGAPCRAPRRVPGYAPGLQLAAAPPGPCFGSRGAGCRVLEALPREVPSGSVGQPLLPPRPLPAGGGRRGEAGGARLERVGVLAGGSGGADFCSAFTWLRALGFHLRSVFVISYK